jgi:hypothetical protein
MRIDNKHDHADADEAGERPINCLGVVTCFVAVISQFSDA